VAPPVDPSRRPPSSGERQIRVSGKFGAIVLLRRHRRRHQADHVIGDSGYCDADFAVLCPNCHRMLHKVPPPLTPNELRDRMASIEQTP